MKQARTIQKDDIVNPRKRKNITVSILGCDRTGLTIACLLANVRNDETSHDNPER